MYKKIVIFTTFSDFQGAYSLNIITQYQIKMLILNGYQPTVIVADTFKPQGMYAHPLVTLAHIPNVPCHNEVKKDETFDADVVLLTSKLEEILRDADVVLTHDVIYQNACLKHNFAARKVAEKYPDIKWLHWIHSATSPALLNLIRPIFSDEYVKLIQKQFPNSKYIYPNSYAIPAVARNFNVSEEIVKHVPHPTDICQYFGMPSDVEEVVYEKNILGVDAITTYPARLDRGKQVQFVIKTMAMLKDFGKSVRVVIADFHSTAGDKVTYRDELKKMAIDYGMNSDEVIFLSEQREQWTHECPVEVVRSFQMLSNVFIQPSVSETYSLTTQEAGLMRQVLVLNHDFPPFRSIFGDNAIYRKYSSRYDILADPVEAVQEGSSTNTKYGADTLPEEARKSAEKNYHRITAGMIASRLTHPEQELAVFLRKERNLNSVFKKFLEPLFYE